MCGTAKSDAQRPSETLADMARIRRDDRSHPIPRAPHPEVATLFAHEFRQHHLVHLVGAVDQTGGAGGAIDPFGDGVLGIAAGAVELDGDVGRLVQRVGAVQLRHRHFLAGEIALIELPRRMHGEEAAYVNAVADLAELHLHALAVGKFYAETLAAVDVVLRDLDAALRPAE